MSRYTRTVGDRLEWREVSALQPCPVCKATRDCSVMENGEFARCTTTVSQWPVLTGGWLHRLEDAEVPALVGV